VIGKVLLDNPMRGVEMGDRQGQQAAADHGRHFPGVILGLGLLAVRGTRGFWLDEVQALLDTRGSMHVLSGSMPDSVFANRVRDPTSHGRAARIP